MDENYKKTKKLLRLLISRTKNLNFEQHNEMHAFTISFYKKMLVSAQAILKLNDNGDSYSSCILASHMMEGLILMMWCLDDPKKRIRQYADYGAVEYLRSHTKDAEDKADILKFIKEKGVQRFLKIKFQKQEATDETLLNADNYCKMWYKLEVNTINDMVEKLQKDAGVKGVDNIKQMYDLLCAYKHYSPLIMLPRFGTKMRIANFDKELAVSSALQSLYVAFALVNGLQPHQENIDDITEKYKHIKGFNWI